MTSAAGFFAFLPFLWAECGSSKLLPVSVVSAWVRPCRCPRKMPAWEEPARTEIDLERLLERRLLMAGAWGEGR